MVSLLKSEVRRNDDKIPMTAACYTTLENELKHRQPS